MCFWWCSTSVIIFSYYFWNIIHCELCGGNYKVDFLLTSTLVNNFSSLLMNAVSHLSRLCLLLFSVEKSLNAYSLLSNEAVGAHVDGEKCECFLMWKIPDDEKEEGMRFFIGNVGLQWTYKYFSKYLIFCTHFKLIKLY